MAIRRSVSPKDIKYKKTGVLMGGASSEREISLKSGKAVMECLSRLGLDVVGIDIKSESIEEAISSIRARSIDLAFIALHGRFGEDGQIQSILESLNIPYTGSGIMASRLAMDKVASRGLFEAGGLKIPRYVVIEKDSPHVLSDLTDTLNYPLVIKPSACGSSIGITFVDRKEDLMPAVTKAFSFDSKVLIEEFINGREMTVGIMEDEPLPVIEVVPKKRFFDFEAKYQAGVTEYIVPAKISAEEENLLKSAALCAHRALGCSGCSRVDIIMDKGGAPFILELNSIPGLTPMSLLPKAAKEAGMDFGQLCLHLIYNAYEKKKITEYRADKEPADSPL